MVWNRSGKGFETGLEQFWGGIRNFPGRGSGICMDNVLKTLWDRVCKKCVKSSRLEASGMHERVLGRGLEEGLEHIRARSGIKFGILGESGKKI